MNNMIFVSGYIRRPFKTRRDIAHISYTQGLIQKSQKNGTGSRKYNILISSEKDGICCTIHFYSTVTEPLALWKYFLSNNGSIFLLMMVSITSKLSTLRFDSKKGNDAISIPK